MPPGVAGYGTLRRWLWSDGSANPRAGASGSSSANAGGCREQLGTGNRPKRVCGATECAAGRVPVPGVPVLPFRQRADGSESGRVGCRGDGGHSLSGRARAERPLASRGDLDLFELGGGMRLGARVLDDELAGIADVRLELVQGIALAEDAAKVPADFPDEKATSTIAGAAPGRCPPPEGASRFPTCTAPAICRRRQE